MFEFFTDMFKEKHLSQNDIEDMVAHLFLAMVWADGQHHSDEEMRMLKLLAKRRNDDIEAIRKHISDMKPPTLHEVDSIAKELCRHISASGRAMLLRDLWEVAVAERMPTAGEQKLIHRIAKMFGLSDEEFLRNFVQRHLPIRDLLTLLVTGMATIEGCNTREQQRLTGILASYHSIDTEQMQRHLIKLGQHDRQELEDIARQLRNRMPHHDRAAVVNDLKSIADNHRDLTKSIQGTLHRFAEMLDIESPANS